MFLRVEVTKENLANRAVFDVVSYPCEPITRAKILCPFQQATFCSFCLLPVILLRGRTIDSFPELLPDVLGVLF